MSAPSPDPRDAGLLALAEVVARAWALYRKPANASPSCELCGDTGFLQAPPDAWRPLCPKASCAPNRRWAWAPYW